MRRILSKWIVCACCLLAAGTIPSYAQAYEPVPVTISKDKVKIGGKMYYSHIVLERQTLYSISRAYGVTIKDITDMNPTIQADGTGLTKNSIILIPVKEEEAPLTGTQQTVVATGEYRTHKVKWYEDLEDIASQYGVTVKEIMEANGLSSKNVKSRQELRIPVKAVKEETAPVPDEEHDDTPEKADTAVTATVPAPQVLEHPADTVATPPPYTGTDTVNLALLLALNSKNGFSNINMDFYSGVLMALKDLEKEGVGTKLHVYDVTDGAVPGIDTLAAADLIVGPCAPADIENVLKVTGDSLTLISPLDPKSAKIADERHNVFHAAANNDYQYEDMAAWVKKNLAGRGKVAVLVNRSAPGAVPDKVKKALEDQQVPYTVLMDVGTLLTTLRKGKYTEIIIASENEEYVTTILTSLEVYSKETMFNTYAPVKVRNFKDLDTDIFHPVRMHLSSAYYTDDNDARVNDFFNRYWDIFQFEPNQFAQQGYDVAYYFVKLYSIYGDQWKNYAHEMDMSLLHSDIEMRPNENGALVNKAVRRVVYNRDMTVTLEQP